MTDFIDSLPDLTGKKPDALDRLPDISAGGDSALGGTLQFGPIDTKIPIAPWFEAGLVGAGKTATNLIRGVMNPTTNAATDAQVAQENKLYQPLAQAHPIATTIGEIAPYMVTANPAAMAGMSALEYGTPQERATRAGLSYVGSKAGQAVGRLFGPASMAPGVSNGAEDFFNYAAGNKWGIPTRMAQNTDSMPIKILDAVAANLPGSSGVIAKAKDASYQGFNKAVANTFGADSTKITPELLGQSQQTIGQRIGGLAERNTMNLDPQLAQDIAAVSKRAASNLGSDDAKVVSNQISELLSKVDPTTGTVPGTNYRAWRSDVGELARTSGGTLGNVLGDLKQAVTKAMDRSITPQDAADWAKANRQYFNVKQVANAAKSSPAGNLSPSQLLSAVNAAQKSSRFGGGNDLAELARWAKPVLGDSVPNSGTAQREWYQRLLTSPLATLGTAGGAMYGLSQTGIGPLDAPLGLLAAYGTARGLAGQPASALMRRILAQSGGLLGYEAATH